MTDFVGVDPHRLRILADRLKTLADAIAKNGAVIRGNFDRWGGTLNLGLLMQQAAQVGDDARMMARRADAALNLLDQPDTLLNSLKHPGNTTLGPPLSPDLLSANDARFTPLLQTPKVSIPWDVKDINSALEAKQEAATLQNAVQNGNRDEIMQIAQSLTDHQSDSAYMTAFMASNGMADIVAVPNALHAEDASDGAVLSKQSQALLAQFSQAAQTMSQLAIQTKHPNYLAQLTNPPKQNLWSASMLFKFGPSGDKWDPTVLAAMSRTILKAHQAGTLQVPLPDVQNIHVSDGSDVRYEQKVAAQHMQAEFDPACAVLDRTAQNGLAARQVLGGPNGERYAEDLLNTSWQTIGDSYQVATGGPAAWELPPTQIPPIDLSQHVANFLQVATSAQFGLSDDAKLSAAALANIVQATGKLNPDTPDNVLPKHIREALIRITDAHAADFALSARQGYNSGVVQFDGAWVAQLDRSSLDVYLRQAMHDPEDAGQLKGIFNAKVSAAVAQETQDGHRWLMDFGNLYGMVQTAIGENNFTHEEEKTVATAEHQMVMNMLTTGLTAFPAAEETAQAVVAVSNPLLNIGNAAIQAHMQIKGGDPAAALHQNDLDFISDKHWIEVSVVQGLVDAGELHPPADASWYKNGHVVANADFGIWVETQSTIRNPVLYSGESLDQWVEEARRSLGDEQ